MVLEEEAKGVAHGLVPAVVGATLHELLQELRARATGDHGQAIALRDGQEETGTKNARALYLVF